MRHRARKKIVTIVCTTCVRCGTVDIDPADLTVRLCTTTGEVAYVFRCPHCGRAQARSATSAVQSALARIGVPLVKWELPEREPREGPALGQDDLLDLMADVGRPGFLEELGR